MEMKETNERPVGFTQAKCGGVGSEADSIFQAEKSLCERQEAAESMVHGEQRGVARL